MHGGGRADISGVDEDAGLLQGLPHQRGDNVLRRAVKMAAGQMPQLGGVDRAGPPGQQDLRPVAGVLAQDQVDVQRLGVPLRSDHDAPPGRRASRTVNTVFSTRDPLEA